MCFNNARDVASLEVLKKTNNKEKGRNLEIAMKNHAACHIFSRYAYQIS